MPGSSRFILLLLAGLYAKRWNGRDYPEGVLFTLQARGDKRLKEATRVRVFHGFGDPKVVWGGVTHEVPREGVIEVDRSAK